MISLFNIREANIAGQIDALQQAAYAIEAQLIGCRDFPPLRETADDLRRSPDSFLVFMIDGCPVGCLSFHQGEGIVEITRLIVSPRHFRRGIASSLLRTLENRLPTGSVIVATTADLNAPALAAYAKHGYLASVGPVSEGITLRRLRKQI